MNFYVLILAPEFRKTAVENSLLGRAVGKDDIARQIVLFCASDSVTGQTLAIDSAASSTDAGSPCLGGEGLFPSEGPDGRQVLLLGKGRLE